jgi:hypothetical protein
MRKVFSALIVLAIFLSAFSGCATAKSAETAVSQDSVSVDLLSEKQVLDAYGPESLVNPYIIGSGIMTSRAYDYLVFRLSVATVAGTQIELNGAVAQNEKEKIKAQYYDIDRFKELAMAAVRTDNTPGAASSRANKIAWTYMPKGTATIKPGRHAYVFVLVGRHPLPDSLTAHIELSVNGEVQDFDVPIPDAQ